MEISQLNGNTLVDATFYEYVHTVGAVPAEHTQRA